MPAAAPPSGRRPKPARRALSRCSARRPARRTRSRGSRSRSLRRPGGCASRTSSRSRARSAAAAASRRRGAAPARRRSTSRWMRRAGDVDRDQVAGPHQRQRPADVRLGRDVQDAGAVAGAAHARVADPHHVAHALLQQLLRDRQHAPLGHAGAALRAGVAQHQHVRGGDVEALVVDRGLHRRIVVEDERRPGVAQQLGRAGARLDDAARGREVAAQHRERALGIDGGVDAADDVVVEHLGAGDVLAQASGR